MAYSNVTACNSTRLATKTVESIQQAWMVHCADLQNMWMQSQYILRRIYTTGLHGALC
jgi:hypothetical protein